MAQCNSAASRYGSSQQWRNRLESGSQMAGTGTVETFSVGDASTYPAASAFQLGARHHTPFNLPLSPNLPQRGVSVSPSTPNFVPMSSTLPDIHLDTYSSSSQILQLTLELSSSKKHIESLDSQLISYKREILDLKAELEHLKQQTAIPQNVSSRNVSPVLERNTRFSSNTPAPLASDLYTLETVPSWKRVELPDDKFDFVELSDADWKDIKTTVSFLVIGLFNHPVALDNQDPRLVCAACRYLEELHPCLSYCAGGWITKAILQNKLGNKAKKVIKNIQTAGSNQSDEGGDENENGEKGISSTIKNPKLTRAKLVENAEPITYGKRDKGKKRRREEEENHEDRLQGKRARTAPHSFNLSGIEYIKNLFEMEDQTHRLLQALSFALADPTTFPVPLPSTHVKIQTVIRSAKAETSAWEKWITGRRTELTEDEIDDIATGFGHKLDPTVFAKLDEWKEISCPDFVAELFDVVSSGMKMEESDRETRYLVLSEKLEKLVKAVAAGWVNGKGKGLLEFFGVEEWEKMGLTPPNPSLTIQDHPAPQTTTSASNVTPPPTTVAAKARNIVPADSLIPTRTTFPSSLTTPNPLDDPKPGGRKKGTGVEKGLGTDKKKKQSNVAVVSGDDDSGVYWTWEGEEGEGLESRNKAWGASEKDLNNRNKYTASDCKTALMTNIRLRTLGFQQMERNWNWSSEYCNINLMSEEMKEAEIEIEPAKQLSVNVRGYQEVKELVRSPGTLGHCEAMNIMLSSSPRTSPTAVEETLARSTTTLLRVEKQPPPAFLEQQTYAKEQTS
ncbi:hypothetical protein BT69DRAFT_1375404 [Atractiella rhizophila]|nr:hypothetical protein BT69DRAFT_1375404 [Atractiella rhizophila]